MQHIVVNQRALVLWKETYKVSVNWKSITSKETIGKRGARSLHVYDASCYPYWLFVAACYTQPSSVCVNEPSKPDANSCLWGAISRGCELSFAARGFCWEERELLLLGFSMIEMLVCIVSSFFGWTQKFRECLAFQQCLKQSREQDVLCFPPLLK